MDWEDRPSDPPGNKNVSSSMCFGTVICCAGMLEFEVKPHSARVTSVLYDESSSYLFTGSADGTIQVRLNTHKLALHTQKHETSVPRLLPHKYAPATACVILQVMKSSNGSSVCVLGGPTKGVTALALSEGYVAATSEDFATYIYNKFNVLSSSK